MNNIAVLITCYNRKDKTISCLTHLHKALDNEKNDLKISVYLTDDGSDGTGEDISALYPSTIVLKGNGNLFWAGGMRNSWHEAAKQDHDGFLLLNDDTDVMHNLFTELLVADEFCKRAYGKAGIYIGSTKDSLTQKTTYGGAVFINRFLSTYKILQPNGKFQDCDLGNGNIMYVSKTAYDKIGMLSDKFTHGIADYDYTLMAKKNKIPVFIVANYCGECSRDHTNKFETFMKLDLKHRIEYLNSPLGFAFIDSLNYMKRNFPYRIPFVFVAAWLKVLFPRIYASVNKMR